jgi:hypothetical protein
MRSSPRTEEIRTKSALFQRRSGHAIQQLGNGRRARKRKLSDGFAFAHLATNHLNVLLCRDHVDDAVGYARPSRELNKRPFDGHVRRKAEILTSASASAEKGVSGAGLMTAVQPAASAAPTFRVIIADGKFHGVKIDLP